MQRNLWRFQFNFAPTQKLSGLLKLSIIGKGFSGIHGINPKSLFGIKNPTHLNVCTK
jgi:hypothetical protein